VAASPPRPLLEESEGSEGSEGPEGPKGLEGITLGHDADRCVPGHCLCVCTQCKYCLSGFRFFGIVFV
jgi:hypothetical protein